MGKVYLHKPGTPDQYLGRVESENGKVYQHRPGPDEYVGRVELDSGKIYRHRPATLDDYLGKVKGMHSLAEGGAAYFLLLLPVIEGLALSEARPEHSQRVEGAESEGES